MPMKTDSHEAAFRRLASQFENFDATGMEAYILLKVVSEEIRLQTETFLAKYCLSPARFIPLAVLFTSENKRAQPSDLAESAGVSRATMTGVLDVLEKAGLTRRVENPGDRRAVDIEITPQGEKLMRKLMPQHFANIGRIMAGISEAERKSLASIFRKIEKNIENCKSK